MICIPLTAKYIIPHTLFSSFTNVKLNTHKNFFLGSKNSYAATIFTKITRTKGKSDLSSSGEGFGTELTYRSMTERSSQIWDRNFWLFRWATAHLISDLTFTKEQTSIIFWQFLKKTAGKYFVVSCKHPRFFSLIYNSMLHNYTDEPFAMIKAQQRYTEIEPMD